MTGAAPAGAARSYAFGVAVARQMQREALAHVVPDASPAELAACLVAFLGEGGYELHLAGDTVRARRVTRDAGRAFPRLDALATEARVRDALTPALPRALLDDAAAVGGLVDTLAPLLALALVPFPCLICGDARVPCEGMTCDRCAEA